jgi:hypothetical protein
MVSDNNQQIQIWMSCLFENMCIVVVIVLVVVLLVVPAAALGGSPLLASIAPYQPAAPSIS